MDIQVITQSIQDTFQATITKKYDSVLTKRALRPSSVALSKIFNLDQFKTLRLHGLFHVIWGF
ncbi:hypothetical protein HNQ80_004852 [Anaerosolibacter carboniphilus]|uniref:Uncharacterized protein n=1 Tax=Anaerosolibacter carboniphilus TaxID=1417629 RepID=A0A841L232_9FIRM|nr:hypothetical protein [Anaerosolibacter carboniphilus]